MGNVPGKKVLNSDAGDADHVGGNDWDDQIDYLNNVDKTGPVKINTRTYFRDNKAELRNPADTFSYKIRTSAIAADRDVTEPLLTANDTRVYQAFAQTLTNKTIDIKDNTFASRGYSSILFKVSSTYYAVKYDGTIISSGTTAETVIQAALDLKGVVYFADLGADFSSWDLSAGFTGFTVGTRTYIKSDVGPQRVKITVPNAYSGIVFKFTGGIHVNTGIDGLNIDEAGTPARNWTGIKFEVITASVDAISGCKFENIYIQNAGTGIEIETRNNRWFESNTLEDIIIADSRVGVLFDQGNANEIHTNIFKKIQVHGNNNSFVTNGFKDVDGQGNMFISCDTWDFDPANTETNIKSTAVQTMIVGGLMCGEFAHFINSSPTTLILDAGNKTGNNTVLTRPDYAKYGNWYGCHATNGEGTLNGNLASIAVGTGSAAVSTLDSTGTYVTYDTGATVNSITGIRCNKSLFRGDMRAYFKTGIYLNSVSNVRVFAGLVEDTAAPTSLADPLNAKRGIALWFDSAVNANWRRLHNDNSGASVSDDTTLAAATGTLYTVEIYQRNTTADEWRFVFNNASTRYSTTDIPIKTTNLAFWIYMENTTGASRTFRCYFVSTRNDK